MNLIESEISSKIRSIIFLRKFDYTHLTVTIAGNRLKKFYFRTLLNEARDNITTMEDMIDEEGPVEEVKKVFKCQMIDF